MHTALMSNPHTTYRDRVALLLAHCAMYRRLFARTCDVTYIRELRQTQLKLVALRIDA